MPKREETIGKAAILCDLPRTTLRSAVERGDIKTRTLEGGTVLVCLDSVEDWIQNKMQPGPGRPPKD